MKKTRFSGLEWFVARRLVGARKKSYVSLVSAVSMWGLALGVASLVVIFSITSGFEDVFREKILGVYPHLVVIGKGGDLPDWRRVIERLEERPHLRYATPGTYDEMMASHRGRRGGSIVKGIDSGAGDVVQAFSPFVEEGTVNDLGVDPQATLDKGILTLEELPGGSFFLAVARPDGSLQVETSYEEEESVPKVRLLAITSETIAAEIAGILLDYEFDLNPGELSVFMEVPEGEVPVTINGRHNWTEPGDGNRTIVLTDHKGDFSMFECPTPQPSTSQAPAKICVVNLSGSELTVNLPSGSHRLADLQMRSFEEDNVRRPGVLLGTELASKLEARVGDEIRLVSPLFSIPGVTSSRRRGRTIADTFIVKGTVSIGFYEYDSKLALIDYDAARRFLHQGDVARWVEVRVDDLFQSEQRGIEIGRFLSDFSLLDIQAYFPILVDKYEAAASSLDPPQDHAHFIANSNRMLGLVKFSNLAGEFSFGFEDQYRIITWEEMNRPLFSSMKRQRIVLSLFFLIIIVVAAFNIVTSQIMIVKEKTSDIAILKAMGTTNRQVKRIFLLQGLTAGILGTVLGVVVATVICLFLDRVGFPLDPKVYFVSKLPVNLRLADVGLASALSLISIYIAVSVAAQRAADKSPVEGFRELE